jgi:hypothetical protein
MIFVSVTVMCAVLVRVEALVRRIMMVAGKAVVPSLWLPIASYRRDWDVMPA